MIHTVDIGAGSENVLPQAAKVLPSCAKVLDDGALQRRFVNFRQTDAIAAPLIVRPRRELQRRDHPRCEWLTEGAHMGLSAERNVRREKGGFRTFLC
jgi:hypothetical protein